MLPGLIDTHSHLCGNSAPDALDRLPGLSPDELDEAIEAALTAQLAVGVTAVRDLGDQQWAVVDRHRHRPSGPAVVASGPPITSAGGHCAAMGGQASGAGELRRAVRERADRGADLVKIMTSGGVMTPSTDVRACQFTTKEVRTVVEEAHRLGLAVTAHAHALTAVEQCVTAGVDGIEHCSCLGEHGMHTPPQLAAAIAAAGILVCPTLGHDLSAWGGQPPPQMKAMMERTGFTMQGRLAQVGELYRGGVTLISGADSGINPVKAHGTLPQAVIQLADCGVPVTTALASATSLALLLIRGDEHGGAACGLAGGEGPAAESLVREQVTRGRPRLEQVFGGLALVHRGRHDGPGADDPAAQVRFHGEPEAVENHSAWAASRPNRAARSLPGPVQPSGPRTRDGCLTGSAEVSTCWQSSSGSRAASVILGCSNAPHSQRVRRLASLWCGRCGNRWPQSRATSARNPASLRRPGRCRTSAIASSSASLQAGAGPGRGGTLMFPAAIRSWIST